MKENTLELSFEMYEELKETLIKTPPHGVGRAQITGRRAR